MSEVILAIQVGDIVFTRQGKPALVTGRDASNAAVSLDKDLSKVQQASSLGVKNGLSPQQRELFESVRKEAVSPDKYQEFVRLRDRIKELKERGSDATVLRYLENELQHLVIREGIAPRDYMVQEKTLVKF